ncbi:dynein regulatory complex subunit 7 [Hypomesus transpacificus]|uniref:dynein regulatory complex subunit 7 n=1 Tax=Hypomesus transpacificus TaxID=137520 RepID=UPI001F072EE8|nr:dynein regulatory complex subunit 7 [Hypomesus transpacificus]
MEEEILPDKEPQKEDQDVIAELEESTLEEVQDDLYELEKTLGSIHTTRMTKPYIPEQIQKVDMSQCPISYKENSPKEKLLLAMADNFLYQYAHIYPDRKPLLLCPLNECGVPKFVSTTVRATLIPYPELYSWDGCASFVSDFLSMKPLDPPIDPPAHLYSPTWVLQTQVGTCFESSTLLCSLLLGAGYNAYCVSGYAVKEMCMMNQTKLECPLLAPPVKGQAAEQKEQTQKYSVKPPRDLLSGFEQSQADRRQAEAQAAVLKKQLEADRLQEERERPPPDPLLGLRVHCWVLVLSGSREVPENFFIDPLTGKSFSTSDDSFLGIECVWNHLNYWVNMQDCRFGCAGMTYDLGDAIRWEYLLCGSTGHSLLLIPDMRNELELEEEDEDEVLEPKQFEMPPSWVKPITISEQDMETRCPGGLKVLKFRKAKLEKFAHYLLPNGLVTRLTTYTDLDCSKPEIVREWFQHRHDHLEERELEKKSNVTKEKFTPGRSYALKSHRYITMTPETERQMDFYSHARADGLAQIVETPLEMKESFQDRPDFLYYRHVVFDRRAKVFGPRDAPDLGHRPLKKVLEKFHRDLSKPASEDVAERVFLVSEDRIQVTYHREDDRIIPAWRNFTKPRDSGDSNKPQSFTPEMASSFQVDPFEKPSKNVFLYVTLMHMMKEEIKVAKRIKDSEKEMRAILQLRQQEESSIELNISIYNTARNEKARCHREELERTAQEERLRREEKELDCLAPFLAQLGDPDKLTKHTAVLLRNNCLADLKQRLIDMANLIQARFERETQELQQKQLWYQKNQLSMTKEDEDEYLAYCSDAMFRIHILKLRLSRHKDKAPQKYLALDEKLRRDPRLSNYLF